MAFIDIADPERREEIVAAYIKNLKEIRERNENAKVRGQRERLDIAKVFQPVVQATEKSTSQITSELKNLKEEKKEKEKPIHIGFEKFLSNINKNDLDKYYGIYEEDGKFMMGNKVVIIDDNSNIQVNGHLFKGTRGLWRLIMLKSPTLYNPEDESNYKSLVDMTNVIHIPHKTSQSDRPKNTTKYQFFKMIGLVDMEAEGTEKDGSGIQFLPGDINGLIEQLHLLLAEHRAGNKSSTRNQIVAILDQLLRRNYLNREEYNAIMQLC